MDEATLRAYDRVALDFAAEWEAQPPPSDLHDAVRRFFLPGPTADIGCGSGRDAAWLWEQGYPAEGFDASEALLAEARRRHPAIRFRHAVLPGLEGIKPESFANILCETVIMHLEPAAVVPAVARMLEILVPGGVLYLSWRVTEGEDRRDGYGRLYAALDPQPVLERLEAGGILLDEEADSLSSSRPIRRLVARKALA